MASLPPMDVLRFQPWSSAPDVAFWQRLATLKLNKFQLQDAAQRLVGYFSPGRSPAVPTRVALDESSFLSDPDRHSSRAQYEWQAPGLLYNTNTLEAYKTLDKLQLLQQAAETVKASVRSDGPVEALNSFVLCAFADLKKHTFLYWFAFPTIVPNAPFQALGPAMAVADCMSTAMRKDVVQGLFALRKREKSLSESNFPPFFVVELDEDKDDTAQSTQRAWSWVEWHSRRVNGSTLFGFVDPCALEDHPGWPLRNYLVMLAHILPANVRSVKVLAFRDHMPSEAHHLEGFEWKRSKVWEIEILDEHRSIVDDGHFRVVGWEVNARGKLGPRMMDLSSMLDPMRLAEQSVDLNLKLMRWRQLPSLNLDQLATTRCLLLGAGTLGCHIARCLLGWGFRHITFVDNGDISHSNPVRQPLFEFNDCGKPKAECAAGALKRIYPLVQSRGVKLTIPMAGHPLSTEQLLNDAQKDLDQLEALIDEHDVIFLGTDSRESRWLPTVLCAAKSKLVINAALGFDSFLVMRHGIRQTAEESTKTAAAALGCYFCNDVVSPRDSLKDRTLDQMCTVTRPGVAPMASALAVELLVAVLNATEGKHVSADKPEDRSIPLAYIPHQLRGFLNAFETIIVTGSAFDKCIACSDAVVNACHSNSLELLQNACNHSDFLEKLTGLDQLTQAADDAFLDFDDEEFALEDDD